MRHPSIFEIASTINVNKGAILQALAKLQICSIPRDTSRSTLYQSESLNAEDECVARIDFPVWTMSILIEFIYNQFHKKLHETFFSIDEMKNFGLKKTFVRETIFLLGLTKREIRRTCVDRDITEKGSHFIMSWKDRITGVNTLYVVKNFATMLSHMQSEREESNQSLSDLIDKYDLIASAVIKTISIRDWVEQAAESIEREIATRLKEI